MYHLYLHDENHDDTIPYTYLGTYNPVGTDISSWVYDISPFSYRINTDFTFELPEFTFKMLSFYHIPFAVVIVDDVDPHHKCMFYMVGKKYDIKTGMTEYTMRHILAKLETFKVKDIDLTWSGIADPPYTLYNNQLGGWYLQGVDNVWQRYYWQVLFLMKTLIRKVTGLAVSAIDSTDIDNVESFYNMKYQAGIWYNFQMKYSELAVAGGSLSRLGTETSNDIPDNDFYKIWALPNCLDLLRYLCSALMVTIDIFRDDYNFLDAVTARLQPSISGIDLEYTSKDIRPYRACRVKNAVFGTPDNFNVTYGYWDEETIFHPYTYGVDSADRDVVSQDVVYENTGWTKNVDTHNLQFPNFFAIFGIAKGQNGYQTHVLSLIDNQLEYDWLMMRAYRQLWFWGLFEEPETDANLLWLYAYRTTRRLLADALVSRYPFVEFDIAANMMTYDKDVVNSNLN